jgi:hypothetical protein
MHYFQDHLSSSIQILYLRKERLMNRIAVLQETDAAYVDYITHSIVQEMEIIVKKIRQELPHFELLRDYLNKYTTYFILFDLEDVMRNRYKDELRVLTDFPNNYEYIKQEIVRCIYARQATYGYIFPFIHYVETLDADIQQLTRAIKQASSSYPDRIRWSQWIVDSLCYIKGVVIADSHYMQEKCEKNNASMAQVSI